MARRASILGTQPTQLTSRGISEEVALLDNLEQQRQAKRARYPTVRPEEPDEDPDSASPIYDAFLETQGANGIHTMTNFSPGHQIANFPFVRYATDVTFQQTNVPSGSYAEKKTYFSGKHSQYGHKVEVSVLPNGFAINCTAHYKGSVSDKAIFDDNLEFHVSALSKQATEDRIAEYGDEGTN
ncbi:hypothetical protein DYB25_010653 [Aphanomyces astaci]|uniref:DDE Tnp4 domain-containing protein n=1 Tax=Aphanomyces astaci TaxID=112090 RepID=A0A397EBR8_APHAT|nr:hypothetical protein DYB25_010653 [Aphanomyces astaci]RHY75928.1 hypothetical protein DYB30_011015 [Aphanomyces astaci]RHZ08988.1 hypothetical protein DYB31_008251 [Aphanomyces astaci]